MTPSTHHRSLDNRPSFIESRREAPAQTATRPLARANVRDAQRCLGGRRARGPGEYPPRPSCTPAPDGHGSAADRVHRCRATGDRSHRPTRTGVAQGARDDRGGVRRHRARLADLEGSRADRPSVLQADGPGHGGNRRVPDPLHLRRGYGPGRTGGRRDLIAGAGSRGRVHGRGARTRRAADARKPDRRDGAAEREAVSSRRARAVAEAGAVGGTTEESSARWACCTRRSRVGRTGS